MIIKKYIVKALSEVDALIQQDLGPNAVILTVRKIKHKGLASMFFSEELEVVAAADEQELHPAEHVVAETSRQTEEKPLGQYEASKIPGTYLDPRFSRKQIVETDKDTILPPSKSESLRFIKSKFITPSKDEEENLLNKSYEDELNNLKRASKALVSLFAFTIEPTTSTTPFISEIAVNDEKLEEILNLENESRAYRFLIPWLLSKGLEPSFAETIAKSCQAHYGHDLMLKGIADEEFLQCIAKEIAQRIPVAGPLLIAKGIPTCIGVIGPTGIGKTTALLKIAYQYINEANKSAAFVSIDPQDLGNSPNTIGFPFVSVHNKQEWEETFLNFHNRDLILVDLPKFSRSDDQHLIQEWSEHLKDKLQVHLALNAGIKIADALTWMSLFQPFSPKALIITKTDETATLGTVPTLCEIAGLSISYLTTGPQISSGLQIADPDALAKTIVVHQ